MKIALRILTLLCVCPATAFAAAPETVEIWHSLDGAAARVFTELTARYNLLQSSVQVQLTRPGDAQETVAAALAQGATLPDLLQVRDDLGEKVLQAGISRPLHGVYQPAFGDAGWFVPDTPSFPRDAQGRPMAYPLAAQIPMLFYNKDAFAKAGLDAELAPKTWYGLQAAALKLSQSGIDCPYTTSDQSWIFLENLSSWHNAPFVSDDAGSAGNKPQLKFNSLLQVRHIALMNSWVVSELLRIKSDDVESNHSFASGECTVLTGGTAALGEALAQPVFHVGVAPLPYYEEAGKQTGHTQIGGDALWLMAGKSKEKYKAVADFLAWFSSPEIAAEWHQRTGYLPVTTAAFTATRKAGYYQPWPALEAQLQQVEQRAKPSLTSLPRKYWQRLRAMISQHLNRVWKQQTPPKQALDDAVHEGDQLLGNPADPAAVVAQRKGNEKTGKKKGP
ncbi:MAG: extracellular solute-binding protein [Burkholderiaceae bacterium]|nr:MAG: extracellular solute-binding protein [Burkholderiaceae bacterium]